MKCLKTISPSPPRRSQEKNFVLFSAFFSSFSRSSKIGSIFTTPIFGNVDGSWRVPSKLRGSTLIQVARRRSKVFQRFSVSLVRVGDVQGVPRRHAVCKVKKTYAWFHWYTCMVFWGYMYVCRKIAFLFQ